MSLLKYLRIPVWIFAVLILLSAGLISVGVINQRISFSQSFWIKPDHNQITFVHYDTSGIRLNLWNGPPNKVVDVQTQSGDSALQIEYGGFRTPMVGFSGIKPRTTYSVSLYWIYVLGLGIMFVLLISMPKPRVGCCVRCSYSLTGNQSGTCPECGLAIETSMPGIDS